MNNIGLISTMIPDHRRFYPFIQAMVNDNSIKRAGQFLKLDQKGKLRTYLLKSII